MRCRCGNPLENQSQRYADYCKECNRQIKASLDISLASKPELQDYSINPDVEINTNLDDLDIDDEPWRD